MATLLLAEVAGGQLNDATARALTAAVELKAPVDVLVAGANVGGAAEAAAKLQGVRKCWSPTILATSTASRNRWRL
jgi:electron transfer flavoprotein alpha subunit